ncbi:MAG: hypothetical protein ACLFPV_15800 [Spirochaetaceae bacterium]
MKRQTRRIAFIVVLLMIAPLLMLSAQQNATITRTTGKVEVLTNNQWSPAETGTTVPLGATISTGFNSTATLEVGNATLQVRPLTRMRLEELAEQQGVLRADLFMPVGRVRAAVRTTEGVTNEFRLRSTVSTASVRGTEFVFDGYILTVSDGRVRLINTSGQETEVPAGEEGEASESGEVASGSNLRERNSGVQVQVVSFGDEGAGFLGREDEVGTGALRVQWTVEE